MKKYTKRFFYIFLLINGYILNAQTLSFTEVATSLGIEYGDDPAFSVCWGDYDNDNDIDLYVVNLGYAITGPQNLNFLFRNDVNIDGRFNEVATQLGVDEEFSNSWAAAWCDINNDGMLDLYVCNLSDFIVPIENKLFINNGTTFFDQTALYNASNFGNNNACCWGDYDGDGDQDLFLTLIYVQNVQESKLLRNDGSYFTDVTHIYGITTPEFWASAHSQWIDFDNDNDLDLYISTSHTDSKFYENKINDNNTFVDISTSYAIDDSGDTGGSLWFDYDNDADVDLLLIGDEGRLYRNDINVINDFTDVTASVGFPPNFDSGLCTFGDYDLDGDIDLYMQYSYEPNKYFKNDVNNSGVFIEEGILLNIADTLAGRATVSGDYDNDGDLDIFVLNGGGNELNRMYRNEINSENYLVLRLSDKNGSYNRFGSKVKIYYAGTDSLAGMRIVDGGSNGGLSQNQYDCHFGLDSNLAYDIEVVFTTKTNGQNHIFNKNNRSELGNYIPSQHGHFLEVRDSVVTITSVQSQKRPAIIKNYNLYQNYPNPFNSTATIKYTIPKSEKVKIEVFNLLGQKITILLNKQMSAGNHEVKFTADNLPSGVYLYCIQAGQYREVRKMVFIK